MVKTTPAKVARGARVRLFSKIGQGPKKQVGSKRLDAAGKTRFRVGDTNGRGVTKYFVKVSKTARSQADRSTTRRLR